MFLTSYPLSARKVHSFMDKKECVSERIFKATEESAVFAAIGVESKPIKEVSIIPYVER